MTGGGIHSSLTDTVGHQPAVRPNTSRHTRTHARAPQTHARTLTEINFKIVRMTRRHAEICGTCRALPPRQHKRQKNTWRSARQARSAAAVTSTPFEGLVEAHALRKHNARGLDVLRRRRVEAFSLRRLRRSLDLHLPSVYKRAGQSKEGHSAATDATNDGAEGHSR